MEQQTGRLVVRVYATNAQLPLEGATVVVTTRNENGKFDLVSLQKTDIRCWSLERDSEDGLPQVRR